MTNENDKVLSFKEEVIQILTQVKEEYNIDSITNGATSGILVIRFPDRKTRKTQVSKINAKFEEMLHVSLDQRRTGKSSMPISVLRTELNGKKQEVRLVFKYQIATRQGLAFEHILAYVITGKITDTLKKRMDLKKTVSEKGVVDALNTTWKLHLDRATEAKNEMEKHFNGKIQNATVVGGSCGKADLEIVTASGEVVGVSLKFSLKRENNFIFNKDLGDGTSPDSLIPNSKPWWVLARQLVLSRLKHAAIVEQNVSYKPTESDFTPPQWLMDAKTSPKSEKARKIYDASVSQVFAEIRQKLFDNLQTMDLKELISLVHEAHHGTPTAAEQAMPLYKLTSGPKGTTIKKVSTCKADVKMLKEQDMNDIVSMKGAKITISIPGMPNAVIQGVKYRSSLVATKKSDLKIKTR